MSSKFDERGLRQCRLDLLDGALNDDFERIVADVSRCDKPQSPRPASQQPRLNEVVVLGNQDAVLVACAIYQLCIRRTIAVRQIEGVHGIVSALREPFTQATWQLRVDEELHAAS